jgi:hypothetical protein
LEPNVLDNSKPDPTVTADVVILGSRRLQGLSLLLTVLVVVANLGVPALDAGAALHGLLVVVGYSLARAVHTSVIDGSWRVPLVVGMAGRVLPTVAVTVGLVEGYRRLTDSTSMSYEYLTPVAVVAVIGLLAPWVLTVGQRRVGQLRRSVVLLTVAGAVAVGGLVAGAVAVGGLVAAEALIEASAVLVGLALGTFPLASLHRHPPTRLVWPAALGLIGLMIAPETGMAVVDVGLRLGLVALCMSVLTASDIVGSLPAVLSRALASTPVHRLASRAFGLYLWHVPFYYGLAGDELGRWPGWVEFVSVLVLSLAAAITTYRRIELPAQAAIRRLAGRWFDEDAVVPPALKAGERQLVRWNELRLERLPYLPIPSRPMGLRRPSRLRSVTTDIDLRDGPRGGPSNGVDDRRDGATGSNAGRRPGERPPPPQRPRRRSERIHTDPDQAAAS